MNSPRASKGPPRLHAENVSRVRFVPGKTPELHVSPDPKGTRPLWFYFRGKVRIPGGQTDADPASSSELRLDKTGKLRLVLEHYDTLAGAGEPSECNPLFRVDGQWWARLPRGTPIHTPDGRTSATWLMNAPEQDFEIALCYPYENADLKKLTEKKGGSWRRDVIGLSQGGNPIARLANSHERDPRFSSGLFLVGRERGCDMSAAWVLDGLLQRLATAKKNPFLTWAIPLADPDAARSGAWRSEPDLATQWDPHSSRPEIHAIQADLKRWKARCKPALGLSICAAELSEVSGITCTLPDPDRYKEQHQFGLKWANVLKQKLGSDFASPDFVRPAAHPKAGFTDWLAGSKNLCGLTLHIPWCRSGDTVLSPKKYRDAGRLIADGLIEKKH